MPTLFALLPRLRAGLPLVGAIFGLAAATRAQAASPRSAQARARAQARAQARAGTTFFFDVPVNHIAAANDAGEAVQFTGTGTIESRLVLDPDTSAHVLVATFDFNGITGVGQISRSTYQLTTREAMMLPHADTQSISLTFPMEPRPRDVLQQLRTGVAHVRFAVNPGTGEITAITASSMALM